MGLTPVLVSNSNYGIFNKEKIARKIYKSIITIKLHRVVTVSLRLPLFPFPPWSIKPSASWWVKAESVLPFFFVFFFHSSGNCQDACLAIRAGQAVYAQHLNCQLCWMTGFNHFKYHFTHWISSRCGATEKISAGASPDGPSRGAPRWGRGIVTFQERSVGKDLK